MSLTQTYNLAHTARGKLSREANRADYDLRLLVGHANLLDSITLELAEAQREQEHWFNHTVWLAEDVVEDDDSDSSDSSDDGSDSDVEYDLDLDLDQEEEEEEDQRRIGKHQGVGLVRRTNHPTTTTDVTVTISSIELDEEEYEDDEADSGDLALVRTSSHPPPELLQDDEDESEDDMPPSPPQPILHDFTEDERKAISTTSFYDENRFSSQSTSRLRTETTPLFDEEYFLPRPTTMTSSSSMTVQAF